MVVIHDVPNREPRGRARQDAVRENEEASSKIHRRATDGTADTQIPLTSRPREGECGWWQ